MGKHHKQRRIELRSSARAVACVGLVGFGALQLSGVASAAPAPVSAPVPEIPAVPSLPSSPTLPSAPAPQTPRVPGQQLPSGTVPKAATVQDPDAWQQLVAPLLQATGVVLPDPTPRFYGVPDVPELPSISPLPGTAAPAPALPATPELPTMAVPGIAG